MSPSRPSKLDEATSELENEIKRARSFHHDPAASRPPRTPPHRPPKLSLPVTPPGPPPSFPPPTRRASPGRACPDNLPLPPRSTAVSLHSASSTSPSRSNGSQPNLDVYSGSRRGSGQAESRSRERTVSTPRSGSKIGLKPEMQSYEMQDRSPMSAARFATQQAAVPNDSTPSPSPKTSPSKGKPTALPKLTPPLFHTRDQAVKESVHDALSISVRPSPPKGKLDTKGKGKAATFSSDESDSSEDEFSFLSPRKATARKSSKLNNNDFLDFLQQGPPRSPQQPKASPPRSPPRAAQTAATSKPLFSFLSLRRSSAGKVPKMTSPATSRPMEAAMTLPTSRGKVPIQSTSSTPRQTSSSGKLELGRVLTGSSGGRGEEVLRKTRSRAEERASVQEWKQWAEGIAAEEASLRAPSSQHRGSDASTSMSLSAASDIPYSSALTQSAAASIPSASALISEGIIVSPNLSPALATAPLPSASGTPIVPRRTSSFTGVSSRTRFSTSTAATSASVTTHPLSITKSSTYSTTDTSQSTAPSSPLFAPSQTSLLHGLNGGGHLPIGAEPGASLSPFTPLRSRFLPTLPKTLLQELLATLHLFSTTFQRLAHLPPSDPANSSLKREEQFYKTEIVAVIAEIGDLLGPEFGRILRLGVVGGYGPLSRDVGVGGDWGLGRGERWGEGNWWVERLGRDLEVGLLGGSARVEEEQEPDGDGWKDEDEEQQDGRVDLREEGRRRYEAWKAGLGVQGVRLGSGAVVGGV